MLFRSINRRLAEFAARQARLTAEQLRGAEGYLWTGRLASAAGPDDAWEQLWEQLADPAPEPAAPPAEELEAKRRYSGGQVRHMRKLRQAKKNRDERKTKRRGPKRKPKNDISEDERP